MNINKAITYSLLSHIRSNSTLIQGPLDIFVPLIKRVLSKMNEDGIFSGKSIIEIKTYSDRLYSFDFPLPVIENILRIIEKEVNIDGEIKFSFYQDKAFEINQYVFTEFEEEIRNHKQEVKSLEKLFKDFCDSSGFEEYKNKSIFDFIEKSKLDLSKYLANKDSDIRDNFSIEAQFIDYFRSITPVYNLIKKIFLGSIISGYIEYHTSEASVKVELLLDTNFIIAALDLNTSESTHTCTTLLKIAKDQGYICKVMNITIDEITNLLKAKANNFNSSFLQKVVYPEDIYNACERRKLNKADIELIIDNLEDEIRKLGIDVIYDTSKIQNKAKYTNEYFTLIEHRNTKKAALHDATALVYVREKRGKKIYEFDKVNCWFVNNSISREGESGYIINGQQPETIKADDLLNILWLSNPQSSIDISDDELSDIGLSSLISLALNKELPATSVIRELDDNIHKYSSSEISDNDILRIATRITSKQLKDIESVNTLASDNKEEFVRRLKEEAKKQQIIDNKRFKMLEASVNELAQKAEHFYNAKEKIEKNDQLKDDELKKLRAKTREQEIKKEKEKKKLEKLEAETSEYQKNNNILEKALLDEQNKVIKIKRKDFIHKELMKWRLKSWGEFLLLVGIVLSWFLYLFWTSDFSLDKVQTDILEIKANFWISIIMSIFGFILTKITIPTLYGKYRNHSNIENFKKNLEIPEDCKDLKEVKINLKNLA
ncbi:hypothetical protein [Flammeovirga agarivorans]|uniref:PIN domain-containing protein n=1 Tax=Flammeovirga agarivorans TaxID=2726742 RepID=A0A7X8SJ61_9BACT|nr:hypothetical protein [Flammeovirga agarivorans]NLR91191.1 hypothetical protein [Flammeovirga agarivorans]